MATAATILPSPIKPAPVPIAPLVPPLKRQLSSNSSRKRSYAESVGVGEMKRVIANVDADSSGPPPQETFSHSGYPLNRFQGPPPIQNSSSLRTTYHFIGNTTDLEPALLSRTPVDKDELIWVSSTKAKRISDDDTFVKVSTDSNSFPYPPYLSRHICDVLRIHGEQLLRIFFEKVHPIFPVLDEAPTWQNFQRGTLDPVLFAGVALSSSTWLDRGGDISPRLDTPALEDAVWKGLTSSLTSPQLSTIQAGLLLLQNATRSSHLLTTQLISVGYDLALHQDCSDWTIDQSEKNLRRRLAWTLYSQDKWASLLHARPSYISVANWAVPSLCVQDFEQRSAATEHPTASNLPSANLVIQFTALTKILSEIIETFYTLTAETEIKAAGSQGLRMVLDRAKPVQIKLKEWFTRLPEELKMDTDGEKKPPTNGSLHLAYFATEITLHRCIIRAASQDGAAGYLAYICRSAAKTRLISAMDFVNRLRPAHLQAFWPFGGFSNFALIGTFGALLEATAPTREEAEFYRMRLEEYRWTLTVSRSNAEFLGYAINSLDTSLDLLQHIPPKPDSAEFIMMAAQSSVHSAAESSVQSSSYSGDGSALAGFRRDSAFGGLMSPASSASDTSNSSRSSIAHEADVPSR